MSAPGPTRSVGLWQAAGRSGRLALLLTLPGCLVIAVRLGGWQPPSGWLALLANLAQWLLAAAAIFLLVRLRRWLADRLLWSLRNRLLLAYLFIGAVPIVLLLAMGGLLAYVTDIEIGAHLLADDLHEREKSLEDLARAALVVAQVDLPAEAPAESLEQLPGVRALLEAARVRFPGVELRMNAASGPAGTVGPSGLVVEDDRLWLQAAVGGVLNRRPVEVLARAPVNAHMLDTLEPPLGSITILWSPRGGQVTVERPAGRPEWSTPGTKMISSERRTLPQPQGWWDLRLGGVATFDAFRRTSAAGHVEPARVIAAFSVRPSSIRQQLRGALGQFEEPLIVATEVVGGIFLVVEGLAVFAAVAITRTMTGTVARLTEATAHVQAGDFSHRVPVVRRDQLGALAEAFNSMTASIEALLEEQRQRQRLENELAIAREVQTQLFPQHLPELPGFEPAAVCRAARIVSGDYYDCLEVAPGRVAIAVADISGKGISAALMMANLHAALRSQLLVDSLPDGQTQRLVERLHRHLLQSTPDDRYATLFFALYEPATRQLAYTNAGHLPPLYISSRGIERLEQGGPVIGLLEDCSFERAVLAIEPGSLLVAYSDGVTELEDPYGEQFGLERLVEEVLRHRHRPAQEIRDAIVQAATLWCAPGEFTDDFTVFVARLG